MKARALSLLVAGALAVVARSATAQTMVEYGAEARFQLDVRVPDAALAAHLPAGWTPNIATQGAAKDANLRVVFIDRLSINGPDGRPIGKGSISDAVSSTGIARGR